jgi:hypothetical protein
MAQRVYIFMEILLLASGAWLVGQGFFKRRLPVRFRLSPRRVFRKAAFALMGGGEDEIFREAGIKLSLEKYALLRNLIAIAAALFIAAGAIQGDPPLRPLAILAILYFASRPCEYFQIGKKRRRTPFRVCLDRIKRLHSERIDAELSRAITQLKNMIATRQDRLHSTDGALEFLMRPAALTRPIFARAILLWRRGDPEGARNCLMGALKTRLGHDFAGILMKLDSLPAQEFLSQLAALQEALREEKETRLAKRQEASGMWVFALASLILTVVLFDYMYILFTHLLRAMAF